VSDWDEMVVIGRVARTHGLRGHVVVNPETDFVDERFAVGSRMWVRRDGAITALTIAATRMQGRRPVVGFEGLDTVDDAERLAGCDLRIPESALRELEDGQYYEHQLAGCVVETAGGRHVGTVKKVEGGAGGSRLVVENGGGEVLIPFVAAICTHVDVKARRIRIDPPEGLLELNR
jgi:16S rRNA processing protein RimM